MNIFHSFPVFLFIEGFICANGDLLSQTLDIFLLWGCSHCIIGKSESCGVIFVSYFHLLSPTLTISFGNLWVFKFVYFLNDREYTYPVQRERSTTERVLPSWDPPSLTLHLASQALTLVSRTFSGQPENPNLCLAMWPPASPVISLVVTTPGWACSLSTPY